MKVINLNDGSSMPSILNNVPDGRIRPSIVSEVKTERLSSIIRYANEIMETSIKEVFIEVKFNTKYGARPKRLEIVTKLNETIEVFKFSKQSSFEQDSIELQKVINELSQIYESYKFKGLIIIHSPQISASIIKGRMETISPSVQLIIK